MPDFDPDELVTGPTIAERLGCRPGTVRSWRLRGLMPEPAGRYGPAFVWRWADVEVVPIVRRAIGRPQAGESA
jgi:hypothetical protein